MSRTPRRLGLLDAMILVAAVAIGIAWARFLHHPERNIEGPDFYAPWNKDQPFHSFLVDACRTIRYMSPCVATIAVGLLILWFRKPRPASQRLFRQPGTSACAMVAICLCVQVLRLVGRSLDWFIAGGQLDDAPNLAIADWWELLDFTNRSADYGLAVLAAWSILAVSGRLRAERSALDRMGCFVGTFWVVALFVMAWEVY